MINSFNLIPVLISGLLFVGVSFMALVLKLIHKDVCQLRKFTINHITDLAEDIGKIKGKLGINDD